MQNKSISRKRTGIGTSVFGILCNLMLSAAKITVGILFGLVSVLADGLNNLSDMGSSCISMISFCVSEKPADEKHPYGHKRAEYVATMATGFIILLVAVELFRESIGKIIDGTLMTDSAVIYAVLAASIVTKAIMFATYFVMAKRINSDSLKAAATDSICDCFATLAVIIGLIITHFTGKATDGWIGIFVALFIAWQGVKILREQTSKLIGQAVDPQIAENVKNLIRSTDGVLGAHDLMIFSYGDGKYFATVHISMDSNTPSLEAHAVLDGIEEKVFKEYGVNLTAHFDPVDLNDSEAVSLENAVFNAISNVAEGIRLHDFRIIRGAENKIEFDVCVPYSLKTDDDALREQIEKIVSEICDYQPYITIDRE